jgi:2,5-diamino-6-(ribosylamino)-4(3H)-pyrimidinone 5'-phosphate reductase
VLITTNPKHPVFGVQEENLHIIYQQELSLGDALKILYADFGCERLTIQSGGRLNGLFLREKLIDYVDIIVAPILIGGKDTSTLIDGDAIKSRSELNDLAALELESCIPLRDSYIRLKYKVKS